MDLSSKKILPQIQEYLLTKRLVVLWTPFLFMETTKIPRGPLRVPSIPAYARPQQKFLLLLVLVLDGVCIMSKFQRLTSHSIVIQLMRLTLLLLWFTGTKIDIFSRRIPFVPGIVHRRILYYCDNGCYHDLLAQTGALVFILIYKTQAGEHFFRFGTMLSKYDNVRMGLGPSLRSYQNIFLVVLAKF